MLIKKCYLIDFEVALPLHSILLPKLIDHPKLPDQPQPIVITKVKDMTLEQL